VSAHLLDDNDDGGDGDDAVGFVFDFDSTSGKGFGAVELPLGDDGDDGDEGDIWGKAKQKWKIIVRMGDLGLGSDV
jgi:hypothetical protein